LVFAFSITPRKTWHDLIATHQDGRKPSYDFKAKGDQLNKTVIHCSCDVQVAESPFLGVHLSLHLGLPALPKIYFSESGNDPYFQIAHFYGLRGPPALV
jgi:hypothetical protein